MRVKLKKLNTLTSDLTPFGVLFFKGGFMKKEKEIEKSYRSLFFSLRRDVSKKEVIALLKDLYITAYEEGQQDGYSEGYTKALEENDNEEED